MLIDGISLALVIKELHTEVTGTRISRIYQPEADEIVFLLSNKKRLVLSSSGERCRINLSESQKANPEKAPNFCMLLRKYLLSGRIEKITQQGLERVAYIEIEARDELGNAANFNLVCELMGRNSNLILVDDKGIVVDSIRRVPPDVSSIRQILPGVRYRLPPMEKQDIRELSAEEVEAVLKKDQVNGVSAEKSLLNNFSGMFPAMAREITSYAEENGNGIAETAKALVLKAIENPNPNIDFDSDGVPQYFSPLNIRERKLEYKKEYPLMNGCIDEYYKVRDEKRMLARAINAQQQLIKKNIGNVEKRLKQQLDILVSAKDAEKLRINGELLTANLYNIKRGQSKATVFNYYTNENMDIPLDPKFAPSVNAQRYYKRYGKLKTAEGLAKTMSEKLKNELDYLEELNFDLTQAETMEDAMDIRDELIRQGYIKETGKPKPKLKDPLVSPMKFRTSDGFTVLAGRNSRQNDALTMRAAKESDIWLHSKNIPGSHVIIFTDGKTVTDTAIFEAATIAACNCKASANAKVDIDYTQRRNVWKPNGAKPGMVLFDNNKTVSVKPDAELVKKLEVL